jgi:hypothetical protein
MTNDEILMLVAQVMTSGIKQEGAKFTLPESMIIELVRRAQKAEREACAKVCEELVLAYAGNASATANQCADAIRARGDEERFSKDWQETVARVEAKLKEKNT